MELSLGEWLCWLFAGLFFLSGLLTGIWKYIQMEKSAEAKAHYYVDIAHRTSLMYAFACVLLAHFVSMSVFSDWVNALSAAFPILFFVLAVLGYVVHGILGDTDNQLRKPNVLGKKTLPAYFISIFMWSLIVCEVGGFLVLFTGFLLGLNVNG